jgi:ribosomal protein S18 acetylase RimI-like enzyme
MQKIPPITIRRMRKSDLAQAAEIHAKTFERQTRSQEWLECNFNAWPRILSYVAVKPNICFGYILWNQKSGFRSEVVLELEQVAVAPEFGGQGIGRNLIEASLSDIRTQLSHQGANIKHIVVSTRKDNDAQKLYRSALGAEVEAVLSDLYSADEVIMIARHTGQDVCLPD